jgi:hypothetical protein
MKFVLEFNMDNAAFDQRDDATGEAMRILRAVHDQVALLPEDKNCYDFLQVIGDKVLDVNGNTIGEWKVLRDE